MSSASSTATLTEFMTLLSFDSDAAKIFKSSMLSQSMIVVRMGLDSLYPSDALIFHAIGFRQTVKSLGQRASPWGTPFLNLMISEISLPFLVVTTILVLQLLDRYLVVLHSQVGNLDVATCLVAVDVRADTLFLQIIGAAIAVITVEPTFQRGFRVKRKILESCGFLNCGLFSSFVFAELVLHLA